MTKSNFMARRPGDIRSDDILATLQELLDNHLELIGPVFTGDSGAAIVGVHCNKVGDLVLVLGNGQRFPVSVLGEI